MHRIGTMLVMCVLAGLAASLPARSAASGHEPAPALVRIEQVEVRLSVIGPVVLLKAGNRAIPIFVDAVVAESINGALSGQKTRRPLSHDLMHTILTKFEGKVTQAIITLKDDTFYADLTVAVRDVASVFDSRSSDAIALAIHFKAPILVSRELLESAGREQKPDAKEKWL